MPDTPYTVVVVDDTDAWRSVLVETLAEAGFHVIPCVSNDEALEILLKQKEPFHVAVLDLRLDDSDPTNQDGLLLARDIYEMHEYTKTIILTGYPSISSVKSAIKDHHVFDYLVKDPLLEKSPSSEDIYQKKRSNEKKAFDYKRFVELVRDAAKESERLRAPQLFLSYARVDVERVREVYARLSEYGLNLWMDEEKLFGGEKWKPVIIKEIQDSDFVLVLLSPNSFTESKFLKREIQEALEVAKGKWNDEIYIIPIRLEKFKIPEEMGLNHYHWVDLFKERGWEKLLQAIRVGEKRLQR